MKNWRLGISRTGLTGPRCTGMFSNHLPISHIKHNSSILHDSLNFLTYNARVQEQIDATLIDEQNDIGDVIRTIIETFILLILLSFIVCVLQIQYTLEVFHFTFSSSNSSVLIDISYSYPPRYLEAIYLISRQLFHKCMTQATIALQPQRHHLR